MSKYGLKSLRASLSPDEKALMNQMYWKGERQGMIFSFSRYMGHAFAYAMYPLINRLYKDKSSEEKAVALKRQATFWNMESTFHNFCLGIMASLEKDHAETGNTTVESIDSVKASLIGPFAAVGDTLFWVVWRIIVTGIALNFSLQGSIVGPLLFIIAYNAPKYYARYHLQLLGYRAGTEFLTTLSQSGMVQNLTKAASILGTFMIGGMVPMLISVPVVATFSMNGVEQGLADIFNNIIPGLLELIVLLVMLTLVKKKVNPIWIVLGSFVVGIAGAAVGIF